MAQKLHILIFLLVCWVKSYSQDVSKAFELISKGNYDRAIEILDFQKNPKGLVKLSKAPDLQEFFPTLITQYGKCLIYSSKKFPGYSLESALLFIDDNNVKNFVLRKTNYPTLLELGISIQSVTDLRKQIDDELFVTTKEKNNLAALVGFITSQPNSAHLSEAIEMRDKIAYKQALSQKTLASLNNFLANYPNSKQFVEVVQIRNTIAFDSAQALNTLEAYNNFIENYKKAKEISSAIHLRDSCAFAIAKKSDTEDGYNYFIKKYPQSEYINIAIVDRDKKAYQTALNLNTSDAYENFVANYPNSDQAVLIKQKILISHYDKILKADNNLAFKEYIEKYPHTQKAKELASKFYPNPYKEYNNGYERDMYGFGYDYYNDHRIPPIYESVRDFKEGLAAVAAYEYEKMGNYFNESKSLKWGFISKDGTAVADLKYDDVFDFNESLAAYKMDGAWGYLDRSGKIAIQNKYSSVRSFSEGIAAVRGLTSSCFFINQNGEKINNQTYDDASSFANGISLVRRGNDYFLIRTNGDVEYGLNEILKNRIEDLGISDDQNIQIEESFPIGNEVSVFELYGRHALYIVYFINTKTVVKSFTFNKDWRINEKNHNSTVLPPKAIITSKRDRRSAYYGPINFGILSLKGKYIVEPNGKYETIKLFDNILIARENINTSSDPSWLVLDLNGKMLTNKRYMRIMDYKNGFTFASNYEGFGEQEDGFWGRCGIIDRNGIERSEFKYPIVKPFNENGIAFVADNTLKDYRRWALIDTNGNIVNDAWYDYVEYLGRNWYRIKLNGRFGFLNGFNNYSLLNEKLYDEGYFFSSSLISVKEDNLFYLIDTFGSVKSKSYEALYLPSNGIAQVSSQGKWGYINVDGKEVVPLIYDAAGPCFNDRAIVSLNGKVGFINKQGKIVIPFKYNKARFSARGFAKVEDDNGEFIIDNLGNCMIGCK